MRWSSTSSTRRAQISPTLSEYGVLIWQVSPPRTGPTRAPALTDRSSTCQTCVTTRSGPGLSSGAALLSGPTRAAIPEP